MDAFFLLHVRTIMVNKSLLNEKMKSTEKDDKLYYFLRIFYMIGYG